MSGLALLTVVPQQFWSQLMEELPETGALELRLVFVGLRATMEEHSESPAPLCLCESSNEDFHSGWVTHGRHLGGGRRVRSIGWRDASVNLCRICICLSAVRDRNTV